jgi:hypothetical protein
MNRFSTLLNRAAGVAFYTAFSSIFYAYLTFYFVYPVISLIPLSIYSASLYLYVIYSILFTIAVGILIEEGQDAFTVLILSVFFGYILSIIYAGMPAILYGYHLYLSGLQVIFFFSRSWVLLFIYIIFGIIGLIIGGAIREYLE